MPSKIDFERLRQEFERSPAKNTTVQSLKAVIEQRLQRLIAQNPLRTNFQAHYQEIVAEYNQEKDRVTIEHTFEQLLRFVQTLDTEEARAIREGLDVETVAIYDLLTKPSLDAKEISRIKQVAVALLGTLKQEQLRVNQWRDKEATRDAVRATIFDFLYSDNTGLPATYTEEEVKTKSADVFQHIFYAYSVIPSPVYASAR